MLQLPLRILAFSLAIGLALRTALYSVYHSQFQSLSGTQLAQAAVGALRFDAQLYLYLYALPFLLFLLPMRFARRPRWLRFWAWLCCAALCANIALSIADIIYYGEVSRHIAGEIFTLREESGFMLHAALQTYLPYTLGGLAAIAAVIWLWRRWIIRPIGEPRRLGIFSSAAQITALLLMYTLCIRGWVFSGKPLGLIDAFAGQSRMEANLIIPPLLSISRAADKEPLRLLDNSEMQKLAAQYPAPFLYQAAGSGQRKNVVFILLESWSYRYIDSLAGSHWGATPYFDSLIAKSTVYDHFYAAGQRSTFGIQASLTSMPALPDNPNIGFGLEVNNFTKIAGLADQAGYRTIMMQSSARRSLHMDNVASLIGFREYYGMEDFPDAHATQETPPYGWDDNTLNFLNNKLSGETKPFFVFVFTGTTHNPFVDPGEQYHIYPQIPNTEGSFLNTLRFSDHALEEFMQKASQQPWYNNTIFIFTADHVLHSIGEQNPDENFHIPLVIYEPGAAPQRSSRLASQYDIMPTIADYMGIQGNIYTYGQSLLQPDKHLPIMLNAGSVFGLVSAGGTAEYQGHKILKHKGSIQAAQQELFYRMQSADAKLRTNRWTTP